MPRRVTYQLRIALKGTKPPIWRRILVSPSMKLDRLHIVIQAVMGWEDCHPEHEHTKEWMGEGFDPEVFSVQAVDQMLRRMRW